MRGDANATGIFRYMVHIAIKYINIYIYARSHLYCMFGNGAKFKKAAKLTLLRLRIVVERDLFTNLNKLCTQNVLNYHERRRPFKYCAHTQKRGSEITARHLFAWAKSIIAK